MAPLRVEAWSASLTTVNELQFAMLKIAIVGCGKVADQHVLAIHRVPDCKIEALCDREFLMARQLGERFGISKCFSDLKRNAGGRLS